MTDHSRRSLLVAIFLASGFFQGIAAPAVAQPGPPLEFSKSFGPGTIGPGSVSTLTFTIENVGATAITGLAFTDTLPAGMTIAAAAGAATTCSPSMGVGPTLSAPAGGTTISLSDAAVGGFSTCTVTVNVTASGAGTYENTTSVLSSNHEDGDADSAFASLTVATDRPGFSKVFSPSSVDFGGKSTLTFTIDNTANASTANTLSFSDNLPTGMLVADPANASTNCENPSLPATLTAVPGTASISLSSFGTPTFPALAAGASCTVIVDVIGGSIGDLENVSDELMANIGSSGTEVSAGKAAATLTVEGFGVLLELDKEFTDDPVAPGGIATLEFTVTNKSRDFAATDIGFLDLIDPLGDTPQLTGLTPSELLPKAACGGTFDFDGSMLELTGGSLPPEGSCTFDVKLQVPAGAAPDSYTNTTSAFTGMIDGTTEMGNVAGDLLDVVAFPVLMKDFADDAVASGDSVNLFFRVENSSTTFAMTDISFVDELTDNSAANDPNAVGNGFLPSPVSLDPLPAEPCGTGSSLTLVSLGGNRQGLLLTGGSLPAGGSCDFVVSSLGIPAGFPGGTYTNTTEEISATLDGATVVGPPSSDSIVVVEAPEFSKEFTDDPVAPGGTVTLEFTLSLDENDAGDATDIGFTDDLAALVPSIPGLAAIGLPLMAACDPDGPGGDLGTGTLSGSAGDTFLTFAGATLAPGEECSFSVSLSVPAGAPSGLHANTTSDVTAIVDGFAVTGNPAEDELLVTGLLFSKAFTDDPVIPGDTTTLSFTLDNTTGTSDATGINFSDALSGVVSGLMADTPLPNVLSCGAGATLTGTSTLIFTGGSLDAGTSCSFDVTVTVPLGTADGFYNNVTSSLGATIDTNSVTLPAASDVLEVNSTLLLLTKEFTDDPVPPGGTVTLEFTLENLSSSETVTDIAFTDNLENTTLGGPLDGLVATGLPIAACGGTLADGPMSESIVFTGGSLAPDAVCSFTVTLQLPDPLATGSSPPFINTTTPLTGKVGALDVTGDPASDELIVQEVAFSKEFTGDPAMPGGTATLSFTIENLSNQAIDDLAFADNLDDVIPGLTATGLPPAGLCGPGSTIGGGSFVTVAGASLAPAGSPGYSCTFAVTVTLATLPAVCGSFTNATSPLTLQGIPVADPATALLDVLGPGVGAFSEVAGIASIEAEHYDDNIAAGGAGTWTTIGGLAPASNEVHIQASAGPANFTPGEGSYTTYPVRLDAGVKYVWIRYLSDNRKENSVFFEYPGEPIQEVRLRPADGQYRWEEAPAIVTVGATGEYVLRIYRREGLTKIDKLVLTDDPDFDPESINGGQGPQESPRLTDCTDTDGDGIPDIIDPDDDGDGMSDEFEIANGLDPLDPGDANNDPDGDGLTNLEEFEKNPDLDPNSPDTDGDGIGDQFDDFPVMPSNACDLGGNADYATFNQQVTVELTCAARVRIDAIPPSGVLFPGGDLTLIAPLVALLNGFGVESIPGERSLRIINADPCPNCDNSVAPEVKTTAPADLATDVPVGSDIEITFSEPVDVGPGAFELDCGAGAVPFTVTATDPVFTLVPGSDLPYGETCVVTVVAANVTDDDTIDPPDNMAADFIFSFSTEPPLDFGDAPDPLTATAGEYPTLLANDGARHVIGSTLFLGVAVDAEADGQAHAAAMGDDTSGATPDDEDGVTFTSSLTTDSTADVDVDASVAGGLLNAWVDFNQNGVWEAGLPEQIFDDVPLSAGTNNLSFDVPAGATTGDTFARFRVSTDADLMPTGRADDGEVEDYQVTIVTAPAIEVTKTDALEDDADGSTDVTPGDTLRYTVVVTNNGGQDASTVTFTDLLADSNLSLVDGSVTTSQGTVTTGNGGGDTTVVVDLGTVPGSGGTATITFDAMIASPVGTGVTSVSNQGTVSGGNFANVLSDDPDVGGTADPTVVPLNAAPVIEASKEDLLLIDADGSSDVSPGDTLFYEFVVTNSGNQDAGMVTLTDLLADANLSLVAGSVVKDTGSVTTGNAGGDTTVVVDVGTLAGGGGMATIGFEAVIADPVGAGVTSVSNQGTVSGGNFTDEPTDDPNTPTDDDATVVALSAAPEIEATKADALQVDADGSSTVTPGDTLRYTVVVTNSGGQNASTVGFTDLLADSNLALVDGSVTTSQGTVTTGNGGGDTTVVVDLGTLAGNGGSATIVFDALIADPLGGGATSLSNQGTVSGGNVTSEPTDDPDTPADDDATVVTFNAAPEITSDGGGDTASINVDENTTAVTDVESTDDMDAENSGLTYSFTTDAGGGADNGSFTLDMDFGDLAFGSAPDFENPTDVGGTAGDNIYEVQVTVTDSGPGGNLTDVQDITVTVTDVNDAPVLGGGPFGAAFTEDGGPVPVAMLITVSDDDDTTLASATVTISNLQDGALESLAATAVGSIGVAYASPTLTLSGTDTLANYQTVLRSVTYNNTSQNPNTTSRIINIIANDGTDPSLTAVSTETVTAVNDKPVVTPPAALDVTGNVGISVTDGGTGDLLTAVNVADPDGTGTPPKPFSIGGTVPTATTNGGDLSINTTTGAFTYDPPAGFTGADEFDYQVCDSGIPGIECSAPVTVTLNVSDMIWFIDKTPPTGTSAGTLKDPFHSVGDFNSSGYPGTGELIFVHTGAYTTGIDLQNNQVLIGQDVAFATGLADAGITPASQSVALPGTSTRPTLTSSDNGIDLASGNTIRGLDIGNTTGTGINGTEVGTLTVTEVGISGTGGGVDLRSTTGAAIAVTLDSLSASSSTDEGIFLNGVDGSFSVTATNGTISATGVPAVNINSNASITLDLEFASVTSTGGSNGIRLSKAAGSFTANGGSLSGASGPTLDIGLGTVDVTYDGTISQTNAAHAVNVSGKSGGTVDLNGLITASTSTSIGINLNSNTGASFTFAGGLDIDTTTATGFRAINGGTVNVCDDTMCGAGGGSAVTNTIDSDTGTALNVSSTDIGPNGLTFQSISAGTGTSGPATGIILDTTGTAGGLTITGVDGPCGNTAMTKDCDGGIIQDVTTAISLNKTTDFSMRFMRVEDVAQDAIIGREVADGSDGSMFSFEVRDSDFLDIGTDAAFHEVMDFFEPSTTSFALSGTATIDNVLFDEDAGGLKNAFAGNAILVENRTGTLTLNVTDSIFQNAPVATSDKAVNVKARGSNTTTLNFQDNKVLGIKGEAVFGQAEDPGGASLDVNYERNEVRNTNLDLGVGVMLGASNEASLTFDILDNNAAGCATCGFFVPAVAITISANNNFGNTSPATVEGRINRNFIDMVPTSGGAFSDAISIFGDGNELLTTPSPPLRMTVEIDENVILDGDDGIEIGWRQQTGSATNALNLTITDNTIGTSTNPIDDIGIQGTNITVESPRANVLIERNTIVSPNDAAIDFRSRDDATVNLTVRNNSSINSTGNNEFELDTFDSGTPGTNPTACLDMNTNTLPGGAAAVIEVSETAGALNVVQTEAVLSSSNSSATISGSNKANVNFGVGGVCTIPTLPTN